jgi:hypothetical protein
MPSPFPSGTPGTVPVKLGTRVDFYNDFGCACDGTTDDTTKAQNALNSVAGLSKYIYIPHGRNLAFNHLFVPSGVTIVGDGPKSGVTYIGTPSTGLGRIHVAAGARDWGLENFSIDGGVTSPVGIDYASITSPIQASLADGTSIRIQGGGGATYTVSAGSWATGFATLTIGAHVVQVGSSVTIGGVTPSGYNVALVQVASITSTTITFPLASNPGAWVSGGTVSILASSNGYIGRLRIKHTGGYSILLDATAGSMSGYHIEGCHLHDNRPHTFGVSGSFIYGGWTSGIHYESDGSSFAVSDLAIDGNNRFLRMSGHCFWGHGGGVSLLNSNISFVGNFLQDFALDGVEMGVVNGYKVQGNKFSRGGYLSLTDGAVGTPMWGTVPAVAIDHTGLCINGDISGNNLDCLNGEAIDADGMASTTVAGNIATSAWGSSDPHAQVSSCGPFSGGSNVAYGFNLGNTNIIALAGTNVTVTGNQFNGFGAGAIRLYAGRNCKAQGNIINHPANAVLPPIIFGPLFQANGVASVVNGSVSVNYVGGTVFPMWVSGSVITLNGVAYLVTFNTSTSATLATPYTGPTSGSMAFSYASAYQRCYGNDISVNTGFWTPGSGAPMVVEDPQYSAFLSTDVNFVYNNTPISAAGSPPGLVFQFAKSLTSSSTTGAVRVSSVSPQAPTVCEHVLQTEHTLVGGTDASANLYKNVPLGSWVGSFAWQVGQSILDGASHIQTVTEASGNSGGSLPTFNHTGGTTTDGGITWTDRGLQQGTLVAQFTDRTTLIPSLTISGNGAIDNVRNFTGNSVTLYGAVTGGAPQNLIIDNAGNGIFRAVGIATSTPWDLLSNSAVNVIDSQGSPIGTTHGFGVTWRNSATGYMWGVENTNNVTNSNGLIVKVANTNPLTRLLTLNAGGSDLFAVTADGIATAQAYSVGSNGVISNARGFTGTSLVISGATPSLVIDSSANLFGRSVTVGNPSTSWDLLTNSAANILDAQGTPVGTTHGSGITWRNSALGYMWGVENTDNATNANGLLVKVANSNPLTRVLTLNVAGSDLFAVTGDGTTTSVAYSILGSGIIDSSRNFTGHSYSIDGVGVIIDSTGHYLGPISVSPQLTLGSSSYTGGSSKLQPFQSLCAGAFDGVHDQSAVVGLVGPTVTNTQTLEYFFHPSGGPFTVREAGGTFGMITPSSVTSWESDALVAMVVNNAPASSSFVGSVALSGFAVAAVTGAAVWGANLLVRDYINENPSTRVAGTCNGIEMDVNISHHLTTFAGINVNIAWLTDSAFGQPFQQPGNIGWSGTKWIMPNSPYTETPGYANAGVRIAATSGNPGYYDYGINCDDFSALVGIKLGLVPSVVGGGSQFLDFTSTSSTGHPHIARIFSIGSGNPNEGALFFSADTFHNPGGIYFTKQGFISVNGSVGQPSISCAQGFVQSGDGFVSNSLASNAVSLPFGGVAAVSINASSSAFNAIFTNGGVFANTLQLTSFAFNAVAVNGGGEFGGCVFIANPTAPPLLDLGSKVEIHGNSASGSGGNAYYVAINSAGSMTAYSGCDNFNNMAFMGSATAHTFGIRSNNLTRIYVTASGLVGIGGVPISRALEVNGQIQSTGAVFTAGIEATGYNIHGGAPGRTQTFFVATTFGGPNTTALNAIGGIVT